MTNWHDTHSTIGINALRLDTLVEQMAPDDLNPEVAQVLGAAIDFHICQRRNAENGDAWDWKEGQCIKMCNRWGTADGFTGPGTCECRPGWSGPRCDMRNTYSCAVYPSG